MWLIPEGSGKDDEDADSQLISSGMDLYLQITPRAKTSIYSFKSNMLGFRKV